MGIVLHNDWIKRGLRCTRV